MKRSLLFSVLLWVTVLSLAGMGSDRVVVASTERGVGAWAAGLVLGEPTGFTAKHGLSSRSAVDAGLAFSFDRFFLVYSDYLWHFPGGFATRSSEPFVQQLTPYVGAGGVLLFSTDSGRNDGKFFTSGGSSVGFGIRVPLGIEWKPGSPPLGVFAEMVPGIGVVPSTFGFLEGGIGARWYF